MDLVRFIGDSKNVCNPSVRADGSDILCRLPNAASLNSLLTPVKWHSFRAMIVPLCNDLSPIALEITFVKISKGRSMRRWSAIAGGFVFFMNLSHQLFIQHPLLFLNLTAVALHLFSDLFGRAFATDLYTKRTSLRIRPSGGPYPMFAGAWLAWRRPRSCLVRSSRIHA
jgi:hypothetical protein